MGTLLHMFNAHVMYFSGVKTVAYHHPGFPMVRIQLIRKFSDLGGFQILHDILKKLDTQWIGAENSVIFLRAMYDVRSYFILNLYHNC